MDIYTINTVSLYACPLAMSHVEGKLKVTQADIS